MTAWTKHTRKLYKNIACDTFVDIMLAIVPFVGVVSCYLMVDTYSSTGQFYFITPSFLL